MNRYKIEGNIPLSGTIDVHGAKNAALPILAACVINSGKSVIHNCPDLSDIRNTIEILRLLGCRVERKSKSLYIDSAKLSLCDIPSEVMKKTRASGMFAGALAARCKKTLVSSSGGCEIGSRPIDIHLAAFRAMGMKITETDSAIRLDATSMKPSDVYLSFPSVGATENAMLASALTPGLTTIYNAAREPEISNLASYLRSIGVGVKGDGGDVVKIHGTANPTDGEVTIIGDRIVAATYIAAALATGGKVSIRKAQCRHISPFIAVCRQMGADIELAKDEIIVKKSPQLVNIPYIETAPYPGFPTDCQPIIAALMAMSKGTAIVRETIFENRFGHLERLKKFGADVDIKKSFACINGVGKLEAANVDACDLRCGAALCIAALGAGGVSTVSNTHYIDRGYEDLCLGLKSLGAIIERID